MLDLIRGVKKAEIRLNDRKYKVGDILRFNLSDPMRRGALAGIIQDYEARFRITHIHDGLGMHDNYVVLSLERDWSENA